MAHDHHGESAHDGMADLLDLDGEVLHSYWADAIGAICDAAGPDVRRVLDLGAGTGVGTLEFARRCGDAQVIAVDAAADMLGRIREKAVAAGVADRVRTVEADLDAGLPQLEPVDITWASKSLHHLGDPDRTLREVFAATRRGGVLAAAEFSDRLRFLPDELGIGRPGLELRCLELLAARDRHELPHLGSHWAPRLTAAGFTLLDEAPFRIDVAAPPGSRAALYARGWLGRMRDGLGDQLDPEDSRTLDLLLDGDGPHALPRRADVRIRGVRTLTIARRS